MNKTPTMPISTVCIALLMPLGALADETHHKGAAAAAAVSATSQAEMTDGEVRKVDTAAGKITLKHAEIRNLDMPAMTMVFAVRDKAVLEQLKPGDRIRFKAIDDGGKLTLTEIQPAQ